MKKLCELLDVVINNEKCVVYKVKNDMKMDLIALGCFEGNEDIIRVTKGRTPEIRIFKKDDSNYCYHFGEGSTTVLSENQRKQREMIRFCTILDFGIVFDRSYMPERENDEKYIESSLHIHDMKDAQRTITLNSRGGNYANIRINGQTVAHDVHIKDIHDWFEKKGYSVQFESDFSTGLKSGNTYGICYRNDTSKYKDLKSLMHQAIAKTSGTAEQEMQEEYFVLKNRKGDTIEVSYSELEEIYDRCNKIIVGKELQEYLYQANEKDLLENRQLFDTIVNKIIKIRNNKKEYEDLSSAIHHCKEEMNLER